ncbi:MAG: hypothetical protein U1C55_08955, partial [Smithellaceae bacterium]|nr:hypothetical protein [Smithellaceae bacterium]
GGAPYGNILMPNLGAGISENPTITYSPIQGEKAVTQLQSELRLDRFLILTRIGWGIESLMWLTVAQIGELRNFDVPLGGGESLDRSYGKFLELSQLLKEIQSRGDLEFVSLYKGKDGADYLTMKLHLLDEREATRVETLLGITPQRVSLPGGRFVSSIELTSVRDLTPCASEKGNCARIPIKLKSFFEMLLDLALYVDVPAEEQLKQIARPFIKPSAGEITTRKGLHSGLIKVRHQWTEPGDAYVAVPYRGRWFYIADDDLPSKAYLMLAGSIFSLQSGDLQTAAPVLTLPVGR